MTEACQEVVMHLGFTVRICIAVRRKTKGCRLVGSPLHEWSILRTGMLDVSCLRRDSEEKNNQAEDL